MSSEEEVAIETSDNVNGGHVIAADASSTAEHAPKPKVDVAAEEATSANGEATLPEDVAAADETVARDTAAGVDAAATDTSHEVNINHEHERKHHNGTEAAEHAEEEEEEESEDYSLEDVYNPNNLTWDELEMLLYEWEEEITSVNEYLDWRNIRRIRNGEYDDEYWEDQESEDESEDEDEGKAKSWLEKLKEKALVNKDNGSKTEVEFKRGPTKYLNLTDDAAHVVEFYAPWCPHCQNYKWDYVEVADEVTRRSISPVQFHAVSCDVYYHICSTYKIKGFPTILGWKQGQSKAERGIEMNEEEDIEPDGVGEMLGLDLAHEAVQLFDWGVEDEETQQLINAKLIKQGHKAAKTKTSWHEHEPHTHNDRYHNAALSLAFAIKSQLFQTLTEDGQMEPKRKRALLDFLNLLDWATPQSWKLRTGFIKELHWKLDTDAVKNRGDVESLIDGDVDRHREEGTLDLWGFVDASKNNGWTGKMFGQSQEELAKDDKRWSDTCTHHQPAKGFTCGLWNLFHILTIGSSKPEHELYGFHRGYFVSPRHVAEAIADFVAYFFSCDVCRTNFLRMYDNCGHGHCERLKSEISVGPADGSDPARMELALWLWEVHNSVNARLMKEAALRQNREVTLEETLASRFPTKKMCPDCWLDENMTKWDNATVFRFLDEWYWPNDEPVDKQFKSVIAGTAQAGEEVPIHEHTHVDGTKHENVGLSSSSSSWLGMGFTSLFFLLAFLLLVFVAAKKKRQERRKKFVDSRFVKKKKGCFD